MKEYLKDDNHARNEAWDGHITCLKNVKELLILRHIPLFWKSWGNLRNMERLLAFGRRGIMTDDECTNNEHFGDELPELEIENCTFRFDPFTFAFLSFIVYLSFA
jgi:hypothetical protein